MAVSRLHVAADVAQAPVTDGAEQAASDRLPIIVDLDNSLILTDSLHEHLVAAFFANPVRLLRVFPHLTRGRAAFKAQLMREVDLESTTLPFCTPLLEWLRAEAAKGREIHLCSAAHQAIVDQIAAHLGLFTSALGTDVYNLKGPAKAAHLIERFPQGFVYVGDAHADLAVWDVAQGIVLANASASVAHAARRLGKPIEAEFERPRMTPREIMRALRVKHWSKNALVFVPLILAHAWNDWPAVSHTLLGFICLLFVTSGSYLVNDIADLKADRLHWSKRNRALASGRLQIAHGLLVSGCALVIGYTGALLLSPAFALALAFYLLLTFSYSMRLKRVPLLDTMIIGTLLTSRLVMGMALITSNYSEWLLTFSMFFFFSLATAKRHTEIVRAAENASHALASRGYQPGDAPLTLVLGVSSSMASLIILILFIVGELQKRDAYLNPKLLWAIPIVLSLWLSRIWLLSHRGQMTDDPVSFALRDKTSLMLGLATAVIFVASL